jgi:tetratricopeptide (TPR) repeat protein
MLPSQLNPLVAKAYFNRGLANALASQFDLALVDLSRGIEIDATDAFAYFLRGAVYAEIGEQESAISDLEKALELGLPTEQQEEAEELLDELSK